MHQEETITLGRPLHHAEICSYELANGSKIRSLATL